VNKKERFTYIEGLRHARTLCDMACAAFSSGGHIEQMRGAKLCSEQIGLAIKRAEEEAKRPTEQHSEERK